MLLLLPPGVAVGLTMLSYWDSACLCATGGTPWHVIHLGWHVAAGSMGHAM